MGWSTSTRIEALRKRLLPALGANWLGTDEEFVQFLVQVIPNMPEPYGDAMRRFYLTGETQYRVDGVTESTDARFYHQLAAGRSTLATMIRQAREDNRPLKMLEVIYE